MNSPLQKACLALWLVITAWYCYGLVTRRLPTIGSRDRANDGRLWRLAFHAATGIIIFDLSFGLPIATTSSPLP